MRIVQMELENLIHDYNNQLQTLTIQAKSILYRMNSGEIRNLDKSQLIKMCQNIEQLAAQHELIRNQQ